MPAAAKPSNEIAKPERASEMDILMPRLQLLNRRLYEAKIPALILFEGFEAAGRGDATNLLLSRLDPRGTSVHMLGAPTEEERLRPFFWRYWTLLPGRGRIGVFENSWYHQLLEARVDGDIKRKRFLQWLDEANAFERLLAEDGMLVVKFWMNVSKKEQKKRFKKWENDPAYSFRVTKEAWRQHRRYGDWAEAAEEAISRTDTHLAPWTRVESDDRRLRRAAVVRRVCEAFERALNSAAKLPAPPKAEPPQAAARVTSGDNPIDAIDLGVKLAFRRYEEEKGELGGRLSELQNFSYLNRVPVIIVFEGMDAAGKGGAIRRLASALDPRGYRVVPVSAPDGEEKAHHYLWRFWRELPKAGHWTIFDRSWYGRVLVERVEGFSRPEQWGRAYAEIRDFETQLIGSGAVLIKFWLQIGLKEQLKRFQEREKTEHKRYKITQEDWRNREKYPLYRDAIADMLLQTSTSEAPWTLIEANDKLWARAKVLRTAAAAVEKALQHARKSAGGFRI
ncbi:MAG: polyphosphate:AMP phosphotransferase [Elusimicrobia bacterium]|nr:polyphosphate:AMP phosphotransferase [Elusimicrobiota bacterium]